MMKQWVFFVGICTNEDIHLKELPFENNKPGLATCNVALSQGVTSNMGFGFSLENNKLS